MANQSNLTSQTFLISSSMTPPNSHSTPPTPAAETTLSNNEAEALLPYFILTSLLNSQDSGRRLTLLGTLHQQPALLLLTLPPLPTVPAILANLPTTLHHLLNVGKNPPYSWFLASLPHSPAFPTLKLNLIHPCTASHIRKHTPQRPRVVTETPEIYRHHVKPWIQQGQISEERLGWAWNILDGRAEADSIIRREDSFVILPDFIWDGKESSTLHLLCIVTRRDLHSLRDLRVRDRALLRQMRDVVVEEVVGTWDVAADEVKLYFHYHPTYYHLHLHVVHVALEGGATQAVGKAVGLDWVLGMLDAMAMGGGDEAAIEERGFEEVDIVYTVGEGSELWEKVWAPLKEESVEVKRAEKI